MLSTLNLKCHQKCILDNDVILEDDVISNIDDVIIVVVVCIEGKGMSEIVFHVIVHVCQWTISLWLYSILKDR